VATAAKLDEYLDDAQLARVEALGIVEQALAALSDLQRLLEGGDDEGRGGGDLFVALRAARKARMVRRVAAAA